MLKGGIPPLLKALKEPTDIDHQVAGTFSALTYTNTVRDLVWQQLKLDVLIVLLPVPSYCFLKKMSPC